MVYRRIEAGRIRSSSTPMASHYHGSHQQPTNDQFEIVINQIPTEQAVPNPGLPARSSMNITRSVRVNTRDTIDVERVTCVNQRYLVPVNLPQMTVQLPYGDIYPYRTVCGSNEQQLPLSGTQQDVGMHNMFNDQNPPSCAFCDATIFQRPFTEALMKAIESGSSSHGLEGYQQCVGCPLPPPVSVQLISAPGSYLEPKELFPNPTGDTFPKVNGESRNKYFNRFGGAEATDQLKDLSGLVARADFNLMNSRTESAGQLLTTTYLRANSSPAQQIEQDIDEVHNDERDLVLVLKKELTNSDVANLGRIVLPKREAEAHFPNLTDKEGILIEMADLQSEITWEFKYRFWPNNKSRMYVLEHTGEFVRSSRLQAGDTFMIFKDMDSEKFMVSHKKEHP